MIDHRYFEASWMRVGFNRLVSVMVNSDLELDNRETMLVDARYIDSL